MKVEQIYTGCLAQGAYYITSMGEAAIIDPLREITPYLERLKRDGVKLKYILETHFHADFVSGHLDLSRATGAPIVYGPTAKPGFDAIVAEDNQIFELGNVKIRVLHTPGHTMGGICIYNEANRTVFTGDTLFLDDIGRTDLADGDGWLMRDTMVDIIDKWDNDIVIYPGHGDGGTMKKVREINEEFKFALTLPKKS